MAATDDVRLMLGDCVERMAEIESSSVDAIICDPPYPEISRDYGRMTEAEWWSMMMGVCRESRRVLKPSGSAVFILQPNSRKVGSMRGWLWRFMAWACDEWNMVQDAWWWNPVVLPGAGSSRSAGLMRSSVKACVWLGPPGCRRDQDAVLWEEGQHHAGAKAVARFERTVSPSGRSVNEGRCRETSKERGGVTPFNLLPVTNGHSKDNGGLGGHPASTPERLCDWWVRYISPPDGVVCDPFTGSGTVGLAALKRGRRFIGIERDPGHFATASRRLAEYRASTPLLAGVPA